MLRKILWFMHSDLYKYFYLEPEQHNNFVTPLKLNSVYFVFHKKLLGCLQMYCSRSWSLEEQSHAE